uniref:FMN-binding protein n=1 Tax=uncultured Draconibacterium sp. TaxID=1573823 RepID=UPI00321789D6
MKFNIITFLVFALTITNSWGNNFYSSQQAERIAKIALKDKSISIKHEIAISNTNKKPEDVLVYMCEREEGDDFYVVITQAKGRYELFDYLLAVNLDLEVEKVRVLKYRSEHGNEIASKKWLEQFVGYSSGELKYKKDISAISGATISAKSITADIPVLITILRNNL